MSRLDIRVKESGKSCLVLEMGGRSRLLYFIIFVFLCATVFISIDPLYDFSPDRIGGTIFTFMLIILSLAVTLTVRSFTIDKSAGTVEKLVGLPFGLYGKVIKSYPLGATPVLLVASLMNSQPDSGLKFKKGQGKISLSIETEEDTVAICHSRSRDEINALAVYISSYFGYAVKNQS